MKKVIVFGFEDVLFNVSNVEKRMRKSDELVKRLEDVKEKDELLKISIGERKEEKGSVSKWRRCIEELREKLMMYNVDELREILIGLEKTKMNSYRKGSVLKLKMYGGVKEDLDRLRSLRKSIVDLKMYVVSDLERDVVRKLLKNNGIEVDGVKGSLEGVIEDCGRKEDIVVFSGDEKVKDKCDELGVKGVICKWSGKVDEGVKGMYNMDEMWKEIGLLRA